MEFHQFVRRPFQVEAVQITEENLQEVAELVGKVQTKGGVTYIVLDRRIVPNINRAYIGWWLTRVGDNYRCYAQKVFKNQFIEYEEVISFTFAESDEEEDNETQPEGE